MLIVSHDPEVTMPRTRRRAVLAAPALLLSAVACGRGTVTTATPGSGSSRPTARPSQALPATTREVELEVGEIVHVRLGEVSVDGTDSWGVTSPDSAVVHASIVTGSDVAGEAPTAAPPTGGTIAVALRIGGKAPGTASIVVVHCAGGEAGAGCDPAPEGPADPVEIAVSVR